MVRKRKWVLSLGQTLSVMIILAIALFGFLLCGGFSPRVAVSVSGGESKWGQIWVELLQFALLGL